MKNNSIQSGVLLTTSSSDLTAGRVRVRGGRYPEGLLGRFEEVYSYEAPSRYSYDAAIRLAKKCSSTNEQAANKAFELLRPIA
jgi:hypothetical protein